MKVHAYILTFNEERIIESVLRYYSSFCSKIFIMDNYSTDNTLQIAKSFKKVSVIQFDTNGRKSNSKQSEMKSETYKKYSSKGGCYTTEVADWIICVDADEIVYHPRLTEVLNSYNDKGITVPRITGFNMASKDDITPSSDLIRDFRSGVRYKVFDKPAIFKSSFNMTYSKGAHPEGPGFELMVNNFSFKTSNEYPIALLHYKHIGSRLYESAVSNGARFDNLSDKGPGSHYYKFINEGPDYAPLLNAAKNVIDNDFNVLFDNFEEASDYQDKKQNNKNTKVISDQDLNILRDIAIVMEKYDLKYSLSIMNIVYKFRPKRPFIINKIKEYRRKTK